MSSDRTPHGPGLGFVALIDVLDRAEGIAPRQRPRPHRPPAYRSAGHRAGSSRSAVLRPVIPAPRARPVAAARTAATAGPAAGASATGPTGVPTGGPAERPRPALRLRLAHWGAGSDGEHLAWRTARTRCTVPAAGAIAVRPGGRLQRFVRRMSLWGAGPAGQYLAWGPGSDACTASRRPAIDPPVMLRELPSTPTIEPAASSPAAALLPPGTRPSGRTGWIPTPGAGASTPRVVAPGGRAPSSEAQPIGAPQTGLVRVRGDPLTRPARGLLSRPTSGRVPPAPG